jgi:hypothetical protein
MHLG